MNDRASELAPLVQTKNDFHEFLVALSQDFAANATEWENSDLPSFLEALASYSQDIQGYYTNTKQPVNAEVPSWRVFAEMLCGARVYE